MATQIAKGTMAGLELADPSTLVGAAIAAVGKRAGMTEDEVKAALRRSDVTLCEALRYSLAHRTAAYLGAMDRTLKSVYYFEPEYATATDEPVNERASPEVEIKMLLWVTRKTAALNSLIASVTSAVASAMVAYLSPDVNPRHYGIDIQVVDEEEVQNRTGYGAIVQSLYVRPIELWSR